MTATRPMTVTRTATATHTGIAPSPVPRATPPAAVGRQCARCGAVGTHYLTCPDLRLPSGYRVSDRPAPEHPRR